MKYFIVKNNNEVNYSRCGAEGFTPVADEVYECPEDITNINDMDIIEELNEMGILVKHPVLNESKKAARLLVEQESQLITNEVLYSSACLDFGYELMKYVHYVNGQKAITTQQLLQLFSDPIFQQVKLCLETGSIKTAKDLIPSITFSLYTSNDKQLMISKIDQFLSQWNKL